MNLSYMLRLSLEGLFKGEWTFAPLSFVADTFRRLLDYDVYPALVFVKLGLAFLGVLTALTNKRRELIFLVTIDGSKNIFDKIILAGREKSPESMPFSID